MLALHGQSWWARKLVTTETWSVFHTRPAKHDNFNCCNLSCTRQPPMWNCTKREQNVLFRRKKSCDVKKTAHGTLIFLRLLCDASQQAEARDVNDSNFSWTLLLFTALVTPEFCVCSTFWCVVPVGGELNKSDLRIWFRLTERHCWVSLSLSLSLCCSCNWRRWVLAWKCC